MARNSHTQLPEAKLVAASAQLQGRRATVQPPLQAKAKLKPVSLNLKTAALNKAMMKILPSVADTVAKPLKGIKIPVLGGDPGAEIPGADPEPVYGAKARANIQGNIIPGFNKDHQHFLFFRIRDVQRAKRWLRWIAPLISSMDEVLAFLRAFRTMRLRLGVKDPPMCSSWVNIGFSHSAIARLTNPADAALFGETSFRQGLAARSTYLGDPAKKTVAGHRSTWVVGGDSKREADVLVIVAADDVHHLETLVDAIKDQAAINGVRAIYEERGETLPGDLRGHEHFGFKDGISQPGVRGKVSSLPGDFITPRYLDQTVDLERARIFAKPGQPLLWPGQFLLGEQRQNTEHFYAPAPAATNFPRWAALGSYLVCRRLRQDVPAFWKFACAGAGAMGMTPKKFASMLVGRWPDGTPISRSPAAEDPTLAGDDWANNHFIFDDNSRPSALRPISGYAGDTFTQAMADVLGKVCPHFAHIRKANPRDIATDLGKPHDSLNRMILRRGIPFGPPLVGVKRPPQSLIRKERGLMFISYGSTIEDQFEFLTRRWANSAVQPSSGGHDPIIGASDRYGSRSRFIDFPTATGSTRLDIKQEWVIPTGGGYFFAPPIDAIAGVLGA